jgi:hypothetical protein
VDDDHQRENKIAQTTLNNLFGLVFGFEKDQESPLLGRSCVCIYFAVGEVIFRKSFISPSENYSFYFFFYTFLASFVIMLFIKFNLYRLFNVRL